MNCLQIALAYIRRKKSKTILLLLLFVVTNTTILGTLSVMTASDKINQEIRQKTNAKAIVEVLNTSNLLTEEDAGWIQGTEHVDKINRMAQVYAYPNSFLPMMGNEQTDDGQITVVGFDDMEKDSPFEDNVCRLVEGNYPKNENGVVFNQNLAYTNGLSIGDEVELMGLDGNVVSTTITGFYVTGNERQQTESVATVNRIENQIYTSIELIDYLDEHISYRKISAYIDDPEQLTKVAEKLRTSLQNKAEIGTIDTMYQKMKYSMTQLKKITGLIFVLTLFTSIVVAEMLLCMWMRNRKVEIAVFISLGISKLQIYIQMLLEIWIIYIAAAMCSMSLIWALTPQIGNLLSGFGNMDITMNFSVRQSALLTVTGVALLIAIVGIAMIPCFSKKIKDVLSEMEG